MQHALLYLSNLFIKLLPESRFFIFKRGLYSMCGIEMGRNVRICSSVVFHTNNIKIGNGVWIGPGCRFIAATGTMISIEDNVDIAMEVLMTTGSHIIGRRDRRAGLASYKDISIEKGVWIGARSLIMGGASIGCGSIVAANSFVKTEVGKNILVGGTPCKKIKDLSDE